GGRGRGGSGGEGEPQAGGDHREGPSAYAAAIRWIQRASPSASSSDGAGGRPESSASRKWCSSARKASSYDTVWRSATSSSPSMRSMVRGVGAWRMYGDGKTSFTRVSSATKCSVSS